MEELKQELIEQVLSGTMTSAQAKFVFGSMHNSKDEKIAFAARLNYKSWASSNHSTPERFYGRDTSKSSILLPQRIKIIK